MIPLPLEKLVAFETRLERTWWSARSSFAKRRDALVMGLGLCGLRWCECSRMRRGDVDGGAGVVRVRTGKGGPLRLVRVGLSLASGFAELWRSVVPRAEALTSRAALYTRAGGRLRYEQVHRRVVAWTLEHFGQSYSFHCFRHTFAVRVYRETKDVLVVQHALGHRSLQWTQTYLQSLVVATDQVAGFGEGAEGRPRLRVFDPGGASAIAGGEARTSTSAGRSEGKRGSRPRVGAVSAAASRGSGAASVVAEVLPYVKGSCACSGLEEVLGEKVEVASPLWGLLDWSLNDRDRTRVFLACRRCGREVGTFKIGDRGLVPIGGGRRVCVHRRLEFPHLDDRVRTVGKIRRRDRMGRVTCRFCGALFGYLPMAMWNDRSK